MTPAEPDPGTGITISFEVEGITLENGVVSSFSSTSAAVTGRVPTIASTNAPIYDHGHMIFDQPPSIDDISNDNFLDITSLGEVSNSNYQFISSFDNLIPDRVYFYVAYVKAIKDGEDFLSIASVNTGQSLVPDVRSFTTVSNNFPPGVTTTGTEYLSPNSFKISGVITETNENIIQEYGFVWKEGIGQIPSTADNDGKAISGQDENLNNGYAYHENIILSPGKVYSVRAYAKNTHGIDYGISMTVFGEYNWQVYGAPPEGIFSVCQEEKFENNDRGWDTTGSSDYDIDYSLSTSGNYYRIDNDEDDIAWNLRTRDIDLGSLVNYQLEVEVRVSQGDNTSGIRWEGNSQNWGYMFGFDRTDQAYKIGYWNESDEYISLKYEVAEDLLTENDYHKLSVRKIDGKMYLFINEVFVHEFIDTEFTGNWIMFRAASNSNVYYKNLSVKSFEICQ